MLNFWETLPEKGPYTIFYQILSRTPLFSTPFTVFEDGFIGSNSWKRNQVCGSILMINFHFSPYFKQLKRRNTWHHTRRCIWSELWLSFHFWRGQEPGHWTPCWDGQLCPAGLCPPGQEWRWGDNGPRKRVFSQKNLQFFSINFNAEVTYLFFNHLSQIVAGFTTPGSGKKDQDRSSWHDHILSVLPHRSNRDKSFAQSDE